ncbi:hypothetical protein PWT90_00925 [Aphanocladium album]|nr:hypothetical protein PWT90_00925 [Aphanocladium album]
MASLIIVVIACSKSLYKAGQKRRNKKREADLLAALDKPSVRRRSARPRRVLNTTSTTRGNYTAGRAVYNSNSLVPRPDEPFEMTSADGLADLDALERASTIASESGEGRRRMSDESTLAEVARDGEWTART